MVEFVSLAETNQNFSAVGTAWRSTQSGANHSLPEFPANRENNREFRESCPPKSHSSTLNRTFCERSSQVDPNRNRELTGTYQRNFAR